MKTLSYAIALTGGIATGKSTVASLLKLYGYGVIDADLIAHEMLEKHKDEVVAHFGSEILDNGAISRKKLGDIVFKDKKSLEILEKILHSRIRDEILARAWILEEKKVAYFIDIPLFFEKREHYLMIKKSLLIYAPKSLQLSRLCARNALSKSEAQTRLASQIDIEEKVPLSDYVIENSGDMENLTREVEKFLSQIRE